MVPAYNVEVYQLLAADICSLEQDANSVKQNYDYLRRFIVTIFIIYTSSR